MADLDLSNYDTPEDAARALYDYLVEEYNAPENQVHLYDPEEAARKRKGHSSWVVSWEDGPYRWATNLSMDASMEAGDYPQDSEPEVVGFTGTEDWHAVPFNRFDVMFVEGSL